jgi:hypothetical protein
MAPKTSVLAICIVPLLVAGASLEILNSTVPANTAPPVLASYVSLAVEFVDFANYSGRVIQSRNKVPQSPNK